MMRPRLRFSTLFALGVAGLAVVLLAAAVLLGRNTEPAGKTVITVRLWDQQVAAAYEKSFAAFMTQNPDVDVRVNVVAYATYFDTLRTDVAGNSADDIFWISNAYYSGYADSGRLLPIAASADWEPSVVDQFTRDGTLWGVPQLTDAGIAVYYNADLLARAGVDPAILGDLRWGGQDDTLRPLLKKLTERSQWAYNAANDLQGIYLNYIGSAGGTFSEGDRFTFDNPQAAMAFDYLVTLINTDRVAPPASATNDNGDFSRNQFLAGKMALFQSGTYNLANIATQAKFRWGVAMLPTGPAGRVSVTNGIAAAGNSASRHPDTVRRVLSWLGSTEGNGYVGAEGSAIPAVVPAQQVYRDYWRRKNVDVSPFFDVLDGPRIDAPGGTGFAAGFEAIKPYFAEMFLGRLPVDEALRQAQDAANTAAQR